MFQILLEKKERENAIIIGPVPTRGIQLFWSCLVLITEIVNKIAACILATAKSFFSLQIDE